MTKKYIHVNQHKIRANKKHGTNEPVITIKEGKKNTYCHGVEILGHLNYFMVAMINQFYLVVLEL